MVSLPASVGDANGTVEIYVADRLLNLKNGTFIYLKSGGKYQDNGLNELLYVVVVIMFYATALMVLIATQIKRSKREGQEVDYYDEYLQRNSAIYQKKHMQQQMMQRVQETTGAPNQAPSPRAESALDGSSVTDVPSRSVRLESIPDEDV